MHSPCRGLGFRTSGGVPHGLFIELCTAVVRCFYLWKSVASAQDSSHPVKRGLFRAKVMAMAQSCLDAESVSAAQEVAGVVRATSPPWMGCMPEGSDLLPFRLAQSSLPGQPPRPEHGTSTPSV